MSSPPPPSLCAAQVAKLFGKKWATFAAHEKLTIEYLCGLESSAWRIASEIARQRSAIELERELKESGLADFDENDFHQGMELIRHGVAPHDAAKQVARAKALNSATVKTAKPKSAAPTLGKT